MNNGTRLAAVDLGSNSFRLEIVRLDHGQFARADYFKEAIRQGGSLDADRNLSQDAMQRGWDCLARFAEHLAGFKRGQVRAVATQTLREARNRDVFLDKASKILGFPIDVISGREEARLIYLGVAQMLPQSDERRLVTDIGGRSTELILGQGFEPRRMESYRVGSIAWSTRYFPDGLLNRRSFELAEIAAKALLDDAIDSYRRDHWDAAYGSAGTVGAIADILAAGGWPGGTVTREGLDWLVERMVEAQSIDRVRLTGLKEDRRPILAGGVCILRAIFDLLQIDRMEAASGGLRHGLLCDLVGDDGSERDVRSQSVQRLATRFGVDAAHARRVGKVASELFEQALPTMGLAAESDPAKSLRKLDADFEDALFVLQLLSLRLAIILCHARRDPDTQGIHLARERGGARSFVLSCAQGWPQAFPLSAHLLREEAQAWQKTTWTIGLPGL